MARNFLLGYGERLTSPIPRPGSNQDGKWQPYTFEDGMQRLLPQVATTSGEVDQLSGLACPNNQTVISVTLHPSYLAKSYYPESFFEAVNWDPVGSREARIQPERPKPTSKARKTEGTEVEDVTAEIFVAADRQQLARISTLIKSWPDSTAPSDQFRRIERIMPLSARARVRQPTDTDANFWEVVLHAGPDSKSAFILDGFQEFAKSLGLAADMDRRIHARRLCFVPVRADRQQIAQLATYSFLRVAREMPRLRPVIRSYGGPSTIEVELPDSPAIDESLRVPIFDGGISDGPDLSRWVREFDTPDLAERVPEFTEHGLGVTSASLFGPLESGQPVNRPYACIDHFRVLDTETGEDDPAADYFDVLKRIEVVLESRSYEFAGFSIGPDLPIDDDEPHAWTAVLDALFARKQLLAFIACGNSGRRDRGYGLARIQSPSDCVNAVGVGSCDSLQDGWRRSLHSSIGPGRTPGRVKPDGLAFGGSEENPFYVLGPANGTAIPVVGTSFAAPTALRIAMGVRAHLGSVLSPLAIKALMINRADWDKDHDRDEVGWGRFPHDILTLLETDDDTATIVYQGDMTPGQYFRAPVPVPDGQLKGMVQITATFCFFSDTDPNDPVNYTRSGLEVVFRPNSEKRKDAEQKNPDSRTFFSLKDVYKTEQQLRDDAHKWETTLHVPKNCRGSSLHEPVFDIHYHARESGHKPREAGEIPYALVITVRAKQMPDFYDQIVTRYRTILQALQPIRIPVDVRR